jgi:hypothetical protein
MSVWPLKNNQRYWGAEFKIMEEGRKESNAPVCCMDQWWPSTKVYFNPKKIILIGKRNGTADFPQKR